jgi:uncharacterized protein (DUF58 family)
MRGTGSVPAARPGRGSRSSHSTGWALAVILTLVCTVAGLVSGRPDTVALGAPFALLAVAGRRRLTALPAVRFGTDRKPSAAGGRLRLVLQPAVAHQGARPRGSGSDLPVEESARLVTVLMAAPGQVPDALVLGPDEECPVLVDGPPSGEEDVLSYGSAGTSADLMRATPFTPSPDVRVSVLPPVGPLPARPVSRRLLGLTGTHGSRRPGEGSELRAVAPLQPGDRLRRIDWRATARRSSDQDRLMVRRTYAEAEASVLLVIDQAHDLPASTADWFAASPAHLAPGSLHLARAAAATVAASYLSVGDRVGLDDLSGTRRALRSAAGARHLEQIRTRLAGTAVVPRRRRRRDPVPPQGAVVLVFSAFLDPEAARLLRLWHAQGHVVAGVDCLPSLTRTETTTAQAGAVRLTLLRRRLLLDDLERGGIPVFAAALEVVDVRSSGRTTSATGRDGTLDLTTGLRILARASAARGGRGPARGTGLPPVSASGQVAR